MAEDALTIRQAATLLNVHHNTVRNRIKSGKYWADKVVTEHGETYLIPRSELEQETSTNNLSTPSPTQLPSQSLPDVREAMRAMLEPFVKELGNVREELGRERERRERLQHERDELRRELDALREVRESPVSPCPTENPARHPRGLSDGPTASSGRGPTRLAAATARVVMIVSKCHHLDTRLWPWWRRWFGG